MPVTRLGISGDKARLLTVLAFVLACMVFFAYLWTQAGGSIPGWQSNRAYEVTFETDDAVNAVPFTDVQVAGVPVGKIDEIERSGNRLVMHMSLDPVAVPLHEGARVQVSEKSLAGQPFVRLIDGTGPEIPSGTRLDDGAVIPPVNLRDVLASLDPQTLDGLSGTVEGLGAATDGRGTDVSAVMAGLSDIGRNGHTAVDALAAQSGDLQQLSGELTEVLDALDTGQGQIADLVTSADTLTASTAGQRDVIESTVRKLPRLLPSVRSTTVQLDRINEPLRPIAADLRSAAADLNASLVLLPQATSDLRGLLPSLQSVLHKAPDTLDRIPPLGETARDLIPPATGFLKDANPALRYIRPYGLDISQFFTNFGASFHHYASDGGSYIYLRPTVSPLTVRPNPVTLPTGGPLISQNNAYPGPGELDDMKPFSGEYPRIQADN